MTCKEVMDLYLATDQGEPQSPDVQLHLATCPSCEALISRMESVFAQYRIAGQNLPCPPLEARVLAAIEEMESESSFESGNLPLGKWILPGLFLVLGILGVPSSSVFSIFTNIPAQNIEWMVPLVLGLSLTVYAWFFASSNLEWLKKKLL